jgi:hypothetical protein
MPGSPNRDLENFVPNIPLNMAARNTRRVRNSRLPFHSPRGQLRAASTTAQTRRKKRESPVANRLTPPKSILKKPSNR